MTALSKHSNLPKHLNPVLRPVARWVPPLAVLHHTGRRSGKQFDTPVQAFRTKTGIIVGLAYEPDANWALNMLAADGGTITRLGRTRTLTNPRRRGADAREDLPGLVGYMMRKLDINDFIEFDSVPAG